MQTKFTNYTNFFKNQLERYCNYCPEIFEYLVQEKQSIFYLKLKHNLYSQNDLIRIMSRIKYYLNINDKDKMAVGKKSIFLTLMKPKQIPKNYTHLGGTLGTVAASIFKYIRNKYNEDTMNTALDFMDVTLLDLERTKVVNVVFMMKILSYCTRVLGMDKLNFKELSLFIYLNTSRYELLHQAKGLSTDLEFLQFIAQNSNKYETNFKYSLGDIQNRKYTFIASAKQEIHDSLKLKKLNNSEMLYLKKLIIENTPLLLGRKPMKVRHVETLYKSGIEHTHFILFENNYAEARMFLS